MSERTRVVNNEAIKALDQNLALKSKFETPPRITLELISRPPDPNLIVGAHDIAVTTAVQCYAPGTALLKVRDDAKSDSIAKSTLDAGHHTTRMHTHYTFRLSGVTRDVAERVLHFSPFYNSEQQSQRYVEAKQGNYQVPANLDKEARDKYIESAEYTNSAYFELLDALHPHVESRVRAMYPAGGWNVEKTKKRLEVKIDKICQEVARYVLPIAQNTTMYHTLSELQLLRLFRASNQEQFTDEARVVIAGMVQAVREVDPTIEFELDVPLPQRKALGIDSVDVTSQKKKFDEMMGSQNSVLIDISENSRATLAFAVANAIGVDNISVDTALDYLMNPVQNPLLSDVYETGMQDPLSACLRQVSVTFATKLSHTAESQRQRHRRTPGATPPIEKHYDGTPDYITPMIINETPELKEIYDGYMENIYKNVQMLIDMRVDRQQALALLPNAHAIRTVESGDLFDWLHRFKQRLCLLAQEEICFISIEQVQEVIKYIPEAEKMFLAPCGVAHNSGTGKCPEGDRWCGKAVWNWKIDKYKAGRLI